MKYIEKKKEGRAFKYKLTSKERRAKIKELRATLEEAEELMEELGVFLYCENGKGTVMYSPEIKAVIKLKAKKWYGAMRYFKRIYEDRPGENTDPGPAPKLFVNKK